MTKETAINAVKIAISSALRAKEMGFDDEVATSAGIDTAKCFLELKTEK